MKDQDTKYFDYLVLNAQNGSINSYLELCSYFYKHVFQIVYYLHPDKTHAKEITVRIFEKGWENIKNKERSTPISFWFIKLTLIVAYYHLQTEEELYKNSDHSELHFTTVATDIHLTKLEDKFLQLSIDQRIIVVLYIKLQFSPDRIANAFCKKSKKEIMDNVSSIFFYLLPYSKSEFINKLSLEDITKLVSNDFNSELDSTNFDTNTLEHFKYFKNELNDLFSQIAISPNIIEALKSVLHYNAEQKLHQTSVDETTQKNHIELKFERRAQKIISANNKKQELSLEETPKRNILRPALLILLFITLSLYGLIHFRVIDLSDSTFPWYIKKISRGDLIDGKIGIKELNEGDILTTTKNVLFEIPSTGTIGLEENSKIEIIEGSNELTIIKLFNGSIRLAETTKNTRDNKITPLIILSSFGKLFCDEKSSLMFNTKFGVIKVTNGWCSFEFENGNKIFIGTGYEANILTPTAVPTCFHTRASKLPSNKQSNYYLRNSEKILSLAQEADILTLWHLLKILPNNDRKKVINKFEKFLPMIDNELADDLMLLKEDAIMLLLDTIKNELFYIDYENL